MSEFEHKSMLSDGTCLSQAQYTDLIVRGYCKLDDGRVLTLPQPEFYSDSLKDLLKSPP